MARYGQIRHMVEVNNKKGETRRTGNDMRPRNFDGETRQSILDKFIRGGRWRSRIVGTRKHEPNEFEPIEYGRTLTCSKRDSADVANIQVLCVENNNNKRAKAI